MSFQALSCFESGEVISSKSPWLYCLAKSSRAMSTLIYSVICSSKNASAFSVKSSKDDVINLLQSMFISLTTIVYVFIEDYYILSEINNLLNFY